MWKFALILFAIACTCVIGPILLWHDIQNEDWFLVSLDVAIIVMWADWLWRKFKEANRP